MAKKISKPNDVRSSQSGIFNWDTFIHNVTNGSYVLVLGCEIMLSKTAVEGCEGNSKKLIFDDVKELLIEENILSGANTATDFTQLAYHIKDIDRYIRESVNERLNYPVEEMEPLLVKLMQTKLFRLVLTTTFDPYALKLMESVWGEGNVRVMNISGSRDDKNFDFEKYIVDDTCTPLPPTLYYIFGKAFPNDHESHFVVTDNDAIETISKWLGKDAPQRFLSHIRSKRILALGCKFDDWFFRFFWYSLHGTVKGLTNGEVAISLDMQSEGDCKLKRYFDYEKIYSRPDARGFIAEMLDRLSQYSRAAEIIERRRHDGVFISYAHEDFEIVSRIFFRLQECGLNVWFDERNLQPGNNYEKDIPDAIYKSRLFIPVLSAQCAKDMVEGNTRFYMDTEWSMAQTLHNTGNNGIAILPLRLPGYDLRSSELGDKLPPCMRVTAFDAEKSTIDELVTRIKELLNR